MRVALIVMLGAIALLAQGTNASISGNIRGVSSGVPGVGTIPQLDLELILGKPPHTVFSLRAKDDGSFRSTAVPAGTYTLRVAKHGFKTLLVKSIQVAPGEQKILPQLFMETAPTDVWFPVADLALRTDLQNVGNLSGSVLRSEAEPLAGG